MVKCSSDSSKQCTAEILRDFLTPQQSNCMSLLIRWLYLPGKRGCTHNQSRKNCQKHIQYVFGPTPPINPMSPWAEGLIACTRSSLTGIAKISIYWTWAYKNKALPRLSSLYSAIMVQRWILAGARQLLYPLKINVYGRCCHFHTNEQW